MADNANVNINETKVAEGETKVVETPGADNEETLTVEELLKQLSEEKAARLRDKTALDKALKEKGEITKQLRAKQTQQEVEDEAKREAEEQQKLYVASLEEYKRKNEAKERYLLQGMNAELAGKAAEAEVSGDMDALADIQRQHTDILLKAKEKEWKASRPQISAGDGESALSKEEIMAIKNPAERQKAIAQNLAAFK